MLRWPGPEALRRHAPAALGVALGAVAPHAPQPLSMALALLAGVLGGVPAVAATTLSGLASPGIHPLAALLGYAAARGPWGLAAAAASAAIASLALAAATAAPGWREALLALTASGVLALSAVGRPPRLLRVPGATPRRLLYLAGLSLAAPAVAGAYIAWGLPGAAVAAAALGYAGLQGPNHLVYAALAALALEAWLDPGALNSLEATVAARLRGP